MALLKDWQLLAWEAGDDWTHLPDAGHVGAQPLLLLASLVRCAGDTKSRGVVGRQTRLSEFERGKPGFIHVSRFRYMRTRAYRAGAVLKGSTLHWNLSAQSKYPCAAPVELPALTGVEPTDDWDRFNAVAPGKPVGFIVMYARCRRCLPCLKQNRREWIARMNVEQKAAQAKNGRVWFVTLTSHQTHRAKVELAAQALAARDGRLFYDLKPDDQFRYRSDVYVREIQLFLKLLRKPFHVPCGPEQATREVFSKALGKTSYSRLIQPQFRFSAVTEPHLGVDTSTGVMDPELEGRCHAHLLVFEADSEHRIFEHRFRECWSRNGFAQAKLADAEGGAVARYLAKYLTKDKRGRIWASRRFGRS